MTAGFARTTIDTIQLPDTTPDHPFIVDDCALAFFLGYTTRILWYLVTCTSQMYTKAIIPKKSGGIRVIYAPAPLMKYVSTRILENLLNPLQEQLGKHVTAYRPKHSTRMAVEQHIPTCPICDEMPLGTKHECPRRGTYFNLDLEDFFPSTRRAWIRQYFQQEIGYSHYVSDLIAALLTIRDFVDSSDELYAGVPQGNPASGAICNLIADRQLDTPMLKLLDKLNKEHGLTGEHVWTYTRYADDMAFTCGKRFSVQERSLILQRILNVCYRSGYAVNHEKTRVWDGYHRKQMLGLVFNKHPNMPRDQYLMLRSLTHNCLHHGFTSQYVRAHKESPAELRTWLLGRINYLQQINAQKGRRLKNVFTAAVKEWDNVQEKTCIGT